MSGLAGPGVFVERGGKTHCLLCDVLLASSKDKARRQHLKSRQHKIAASAAEAGAVLNDANLLSIILIIAASTGLHQAHQVFMMEACNTTIGEIARQKRDELFACIRQVCCQASADARV